MSYYLGKMLALGFDDSVLRVTEALKLVRPDEALHALCSPEPSRWRGARHKADAEADKEHFDGKTTE